MTAHHLSLREANNNSIVQLAMCCSKCSLNVVSLEGFNKRISDNKSRLFYIIKITDLF
jgi:hypothetical protein